MAVEFVKMNASGQLTVCPLNDYDGKVTGKIIIGLNSWFDEHPAERISAGWRKRYVADKPEYDINTQYLAPVDAEVAEGGETVISRSWAVMPMSEEMIEQNVIINTTLL